MNKSVELTKLKSLIANHQDNPELPVKTNSVVVELLQLEKFIVQAKSKPECDAIRIYFIRHGLNTDQDHIKKAFVDNEPDKNLSQLTLAFVPANILEFADWRVKDIPEEDNTKIFTLFVCEPTAGPSIPQSLLDKTGMCPPKCKT